jgi:hypothetical protein
MLCPYDLVCKDKHKCILKYKADELHATEFTGCLIVGGGEEVCSHFDFNCEAWEKTCEMLRAGKLGKE